MAPSLNPMLMESSNEMNPPITVITKPAEEPSKELDSVHDPDRGKDRAQWG